MIESHSFLELLNSHYTDKKKLKMDITHERKETILEKRTLQCRKHRMHVHEFELTEIHKMYILTKYVLLIFGGDLNGTETVS